MSIIQCNRRPASAEDLRVLVQGNYGHFTTMQVRDGRVRGLEFHLARLAQGTLELFGVVLEPGRVVDDMRHALRIADAGACTLRVSVFSRDFDVGSPCAAGDVDLLVAIAPPAQPPAAAMRVRSVRFERTAPHLKHVGTFALFHQRRLAIQSGFDDAVFVDGQRRISEGSLWNIGFGQGERVIWPQALALRGTTESLLRAGLEASGVEQGHREIGLADLEGFDAAFASNARGIWPISAIDETSFPRSVERIAALQATLDSRPWDII